jgi:nucleoside triphosphate pyrophosphatase
MNKLLLASGSSRRKELLDQIGVQYETASMDIDESVHDNERAADYVLRLAREKALAGIAYAPDKVVLAADTAVVVNDTILGKPRDELDAQDMLRQLSGSVHQVLTGVAMANNVDGMQKVDSQVVTTEVHFSALSEQQIKQYVTTREPMDKAGGYGIQGIAALFVTRIEGSYSNVVGLPLAETGKLLQAFDVPVGLD